MLSIDEIEFRNRHKECCHAADVMMGRLRVSLWGCVDVIIILLATYRALAIRACVSLHRVVNDGLTLLGKCSTGA
jgi:hypothetical protein